MKNMLINSLACFFIMATVLYAMDNVSDQYGVPYLENITVSNGYCAANTVSPVSSPTSSDEAIEIQTGRPMVRLFKSVIALLGLFSAAGIVIGLMARRVLKKESVQRNPCHTKKRSFKTEEKAENVHQG